MRKSRDFLVLNKHYVLYYEYVDHHHHDNTMKVLFCGRDMHFGYAYTKEEIEHVHGIGRVVQCDRTDLEKEIVDADVIVPLMMPITRDVLLKCTRAKLIIQYGAGIEGIDMAAASDLGIYVSNIPSKDTGNAESCAEMCIFLALALLRKITRMGHSIAHRQLGVPIGCMLKHSQACVVGFGNIAKALIPLLDAFDVRMSVLRRSAVWSGEDRTFLELLTDTGQVCKESDLKRILGKADLIFLTCSLNQSSAHIVNDLFLSYCKEGVRIVNVARGGLLEYEAVLRGLQSGKIGGLGLDVQFQEPFDPSDPINAYDNVYLTPHVAGVTETSYRNMAKIVCSESKKVVIDGERPTITLNACT